MSREYQLFLDEWELTFVVAAVTLTGPAWDPDDPRYEGVQRLVSKLQVLSRVALEERAKEMHLRRREGGDE